MQDILNKIKEGTLTRDNDEKNAGGFWDYAGDIIFDSNSLDNDALQAEIYYSFWDLVEASLINNIGDK